MIMIAFYHFSAASLSDLSNAHNEILESDDTVIDWYNYLAQVGIYYKSYYWTIYKERRT